jgi:hypothetical protein
MFGCASFSPLEVAFFFCPVTSFNLAGVLVLIRRCFGQNRPEISFVLNISKILRLLRHSALAIVGIERRTFDEFSRGLGLLVCSVAAEPPLPRRSTATSANCFANKGTTR